MHMINFCASGRLQMYHTLVDHFAGECAIISQILLYIGLSILFGVLNKYAKIWKLTIVFISFRLTWSYNRIGISPGGFLITQKNNFLSNYNVYDINFLAIMHQKLNMIHNCTAFSKKHEIKEYVNSVKVCTYRF